jgi:hypothetical protein
MINLEKDVYYIKGAITLSNIVKNGKEILILGEYHNKDYKDCPCKQISVLELFKNVYYNSNEKNCEIFLEIPSFSNPELVNKFSKSVNIKELYNFSISNNIEFKSIDFRFDINRNNLYNDNILKLSFIEFINIFYYSFRNIIENISKDIYKLNCYEYYSPFVKRILKDFKNIVYSFKYDIRNALHVNNSNLSNFTLKDYLNKSTSMVIMKNNKYDFIEAMRLLWCYIVDLKVIIEIEKSKYSKIFILLGNNHVQNLLHAYSSNILYTRKVNNNKDDSCLRINGSLFTGDNDKNEIESSTNKYKNTIKEKRKRDKEYYIKNFQGNDKLNPFKFIH